MWGEGGKGLRASKLQVGACPTPTVQNRGRPEDRDQTMGRVQTWLAWPAPVGPGPGLHRARLALRIAWPVPARPVGSLTQAVSRRPRPGHLQCFSAKGLSSEPAEEVSRARTRLVRSPSPIAPQPPHNAMAPLSSVSREGGGGGCVSRRIKPTAHSPSILGPGVAVASGDARLRRPSLHMYARTAAAVARDPKIAAPAGRPHGTPMHPTGGQAADRADRADWPAHAACLVRQPHRRQAIILII